jgi:hypothetical protein
MYIYEILAGLHATEDDRSVIEAGVEIIMKKTTSVKLIQSANQALRLTIGGNAVGDK